MKSRKLTSITAVVLFAVLARPIDLAAQDNQAHKHHHYKLIDIGTFPGLSIYNGRVTSNGSAVTEFQQILNNQGTLVGGADTPLVNPYGCFNPFNQSNLCYVQHAFVWQNGKLTDLGTLPGGSASFAYFLSDNGLIAGGSENGAFDPNVGAPEFRAVLWRNGTINDLGTLGGTSSLAAGVNNAGQVVGGAQNNTPDAYSIFGLGTQTRAFLWRDGVMTDLGTLGGPDAFATQINNDGQVTGPSDTSDIPNPITGTPPQDPFLWQRGTNGNKMKDLGNLGGAQVGVNGFNSRGDVTGTMTLAGEQIYHAFLWDGQKLIDLNTSSGGLGGNYSFAQALNDSGAVVGIASLPGDQLFQAFLWQNGVMTNLGTLHGDPCSEAEGINSLGQIVGASQSALGGCNFYTSAFLWENGGPPVDLNDLIPPHSPLLLTGAFWINDRGEITGGGAPSGCGDTDICGHAFLLIPCDENHPRVEGCDYSMLDAPSAVPQTSPAVSSASSRTLPQSLLRRMNRYRFPGGAFGPRN